MDVMQQARAWMARVDGLELRQRGLILLAILAAAYVVWESVLMTPLDGRRQVFSNQVAQVRAEINALNSSIQEVAGRSAQDPNAPLRARIELLNGKVADLNEHLEGLTGELIPPRQMPQVLEQLMTRDAGLKLVRLEGLGAAPILEGLEPDQTEQTAAGGADPVPGLYRHGLRLVFQGSYLGTLGLLEEIEALPWRFIWTRLAIEVGEHPEATVTLELYSLSLDDAWLEV
jgi:MSHA biogenesis protein MshJ